MKNLDLERKSKSLHEYRSKIMEVSTRISNPELNKKNLGAVYTPPDLARFLSNWAIKDKHDMILDVGVGEGAFIFASYRRLLELGASPDLAQKQINGAEVDTTTYLRFKNIAELSHLAFPNVHCANFFETEFPLVDAIVGNPPYVRRTNILDVDAVRSSVLSKNLIIGDLNMTRLTDLYIYFLLRAFPMLKEGGRLAVITSDPWLNASYGIEFKKYLHNHFEIESLITLDRSVFEDALVKSVLIHAVKRNTRTDSSSTVHFIRVKSEIHPFNLQDSLPTLPSSSTEANVSMTRIKKSEMGIKLPWSIFFKIPDISSELLTHELLSPIQMHAETRIGVQTLAKEFFVLNSEQIAKFGIEERYFKPLIQSSRYINKPIISADSEMNYYLFYCSESKEELAGSHALEYITQAENSEVKVRGKASSVIGYQNKERIKKASRKYWYDLKTSLDRRGNASILIPRLVYRHFNVLWNRAGYISGELFIEFISKDKIDDEIYLAILNSTVTEIAIRVHAQVYGGGTSNINPGQIKKVKIINPFLLTDLHRNQLTECYQQFLLDPNHERRIIDSVIFRILGFDEEKQAQTYEILEDLIKIATSSTMRL